MFLLTVKLVEKGHITARIFFIFLKNVLKQEIFLIPNFNLSEKIGKPATK